MSAVRIKPSQPVAIPRKKGLTVLAIETDLYRIVAHRWLAAFLGWKLLTVCSFRQGLQTIATQEVDLVIANYQLEMDAPEFLHRVRASHPYLPVCFVSAPDSDTLRNLDGRTPLFRTFLLLTVLKTLSGRARPETGLAQRPLKAPQRSER